VESILSPLGTAATPGLLYLPRVILRLQKSVEWTVLTGKTEVLGKPLLRRHFFHHKSHLPDPGVNPGRRGGKPATNCFSYGAAFGSHLHENAKFKAIFNLNEMLDHRAYLLHIFLLLMNWIFIHKDTIQVSSIFY
jgi:hypothetical protein